MNDDLYRMLRFVVLFCVLLLTFTVINGLRLVEKIVDSQLPQHEVKIDTTPIIVPTPTKGYFVECMHGDMAVVFNSEVAHYYTCEKGKWTRNDQDNRNYKLPKSRGHNTGAL